MSARRKANILGARNMNTTGGNSGKPLPAILSRKRKNEEEEPMQPVSFTTYHEGKLTSWNAFYFRISIVTSTQLIQT